MEGTPEQRLFWVEMVKAKYQMVYLEKWFSVHASWSHFLLIMTAFTTSGAVIGWSIWESWKGVWIAIVILSQALNIIFPRSQMEEKAAILQELPLVWQPKYNAFEKKWFSVMDGSLTNQEILDWVYEFREEWENSENKIMKGIRPGIGSRIIGRLSVKENNLYFAQMKGESRKEDSENDKN